MSTSEEKWIKIFIGTSCVRWIISEEARVLEKVFLRIAILKFCHVKFAVKILENYLWRK